MPACCVEDCGLTTDDNVILFEFPTSRLLRKRWLDAINPRSKVPEDARICNKHFTRQDYEEFRGKTRLKGKVLPSRFGEQMESQDESSQEKDGTPGEEEQNTRKNNHNDKLHNDADKSLKNVDKSHNDVNKSHNDVNKSHNDVNKSHNDADKLHNDADKLHNDADKPHNDADKPHNNADKSHNAVEKSHNNSENSEKSDTDTDYDIKSRKRKRGRPKKNKNTKNKTKKFTPNKRTRNSSDNKKTDNNEIDNVNNDKDTETAKDNHNDKTHNDSDKFDNQIDNNLDNNKKDNHNKSIENGHTSEEYNYNSRERDKSPVMPADIEDIISKYQIENKKTERQLAAMAQELLMQAAEPVFIEMQCKSQGPQEAPSNDCLMLLESVQVDVDPTLLLEAREEDEECMEQIDLDVDSADEKEQVVNKKPEQEISLLTSSDEDDVIIQEPKIDTVEVSDETDEDDVPLVKLVKTEKKAQKPSKKKKKSVIDQILWKGSQDVYCLQCRHISTNRYEHKKHLQTHSKVIQICQDCGFTTCSKSQLYRHRRKHKNDKKHKCPLCNYSARHNMSLIYHLKTHKNSEKEVYMCTNCDFVSPVKSVVTKHKQGCTGGRCSCAKCDFSCDTREELQTHEDRLHKDSRRKDSDSNSVHSLDDDSTNAEDDD